MRPDPGFLPLQLCSQYILYIKTSASGKTWIVYCPSKPKFCRKGLEQSDRARQHGSAGALLLIWVEGLLAHHLSKIKVGNGLLLWRAFLPPNHLLITNHIWLAFTLMKYLLYFRLYSKLFVLINSHTTYEVCFSIALIL